MRRIQYRHAFDILHSWRSWRQKRDALVVLLPLWCPRVYTELSSRMVANIIFHLFPAIGICAPKRISFHMWSFHNKKPHVKTQFYNPFGWYSILILSANQKISKNLHNRLTFIWKNQSILQDSRRNPPYHQQKAVMVMNH